MRLEHAKMLLVHTGTTIKGIAASVGYRSVHHFSRIFSRRVGLSPGAFRDAHMHDVPKWRRRDASRQRQAEPPLLQ
jgi:transcriptional regulator GlxA family with amidase domain